MQLSEALSLAIQHQNAGRTAAAAEIYDRILEVAPENPPAATLRARIHLKEGRLDEADRLTETATRAAPDFMQAWNARGDVLDARKEPEAANAAWRRSLVTGPENTGPFVGLGNQFQLDKEYGAAEQAYRRALAGQPGNVPAANNLAQALLIEGDAERALAATDRVLARDPNHVRATAYRSVALEELGRYDEVDRLIAHGSATRPIRFPVPGGYRDHVGFNAALSEEIRNHPNISGNLDPLRRAIRGGAFVPQLFDQKGPAIAAFEQMLAAGLNDYIAGLSRDPSHPFFARIPDGYAVNIWANILGDEGHQSAHIHNAGWLSGTYYAAVPETVRPDDPERAGWLEFNRPGYGIPYRGTRKLEAICPELGMAVVFPSYVWHSTIPFRGGGERISIAFDLHIDG
ncbi:putative 2OG-Fe(II) oxygenase [Nisaea acidiphila]|uniref:2OG-Fe(II) oxygenase n=1 Tax=Nisaea acidiphila TaxID=1862145 RepID=A0A9J7AYM7_9PROT|nr:putative 2OG-Fe(II) oxygenase [Nisaea acidiphila]UUX51372.1 putative 2OG-Fe(II) oxygenase [Nisaea acidiphila]